MWRLLSDDLPTVTVTKTLFASAEVTSTAPNNDSSAASSGTDSPPNISITASPFVGVHANDNGIGGTDTTTITDSSAAIKLNTTAVSSTSSTPSSNTQPAQGQAGKVAGSVLGSFAAFGMIGFLIWYLLARKQAGSRLKMKFHFKIKKSSEPKSPKTPHLEDQSIQETRSIMLQQQADANASHENNINAFLAPGVRHTTKKENLPNHHKALPLTPRKHTPSELPGSPGFSKIGLAVSSNTPPNTPPLPRSNSQESTKTIGSIAPSVGDQPVPASLMPGYGFTPVFGAKNRGSSSSLMPAPLRPPTKPAPIVTTPQIGRTDSISPLSPRAMMNAVSSTTSRAWNRASQALSPSGYQRMPFDGQPESEDLYSGSSGSKARKDSTASRRNPELEIGAQTDKEWNGSGNGNWI
ncbi:hypothetical protein LTR05_002256 [Lithohypha guttulata]|uniref:Uncharacterized protein n=1 Tax=Lithohypha guttulata TaxID=1690604 RepID=A0AAN7T284_9EURO|nr:hypothetical protein LTR05_002256 [Lithohypha guttulata]